MGMGMMAGGGMGTYGLQHQHQPAQQQVEAQAEGKAQADKAWETAFGAFDQKDQKETNDQDVKGKGKEKEATNEDFERSVLSLTLLLRATKVDRSSLCLRRRFASDRAWKANHQEPAEHSGTHMGVGQDDLASWESQFSQFANGKGESEEEAYREMLAEQEARMPDEGSVMEGLQGSVDERGWPRLGQYTFGGVPSHFSRFRDLQADRYRFTCVLQSLQIHTLQIPLSCRPSTRRLLCRTALFTSRRPSSSHRPLRSSTIDFNWTRLALGLNSGTSKRRMKRSWPVCGRSRRPRRPLKVCWLGKVMGSCRRAR